MNDKKKSRWVDELQQIEDALIESIMQADSANLRADLLDAGYDPNAMVAASKKISEEVAAAFARERLTKAKGDAEAFRIRTPARPGTSATARLQAAKGTASSGLMLAARKGTGTSDADQDALLQAMAELERLEKDDDKK